MSETREAGSLKCPSCGAWIAPNERSCKFCQVTLASTRCARCLTLHYAGSAVCSSCGATMGLEGDLGPTGETCPRCKEPCLSRTQIDVYELTECPKCTGVFLEHAVLERMTRTTEAQSAAQMRPVRTSQVSTREIVAYLACPRCSKIMTRRNFGEASGIIVDVCSAHGVWFDAEELERSIAFVASGGLEKARSRTIERERQEMKEIARHDAAYHAALKERDSLGRLRGDPHVAADLARTALDLLFGK